jgi:hypothetical protein
VASGQMMRIAMGLTIIGGALLIAGLSLVLVGEALRLKSPHGGGGIVGAGEVAALCGLGFGVALLVSLMVGRGSRGGRRRPAGARPAPRRDQAEEWLTPLRTAGAGLIPPTAQRSWPEPAAQGAPESGDYPDDGWNYPDDGWNPESRAGWDPGPAYVWDPRAGDDQDDDDQDDWARGGHEDWGPGDAEWRPGDEEWSPAGSAAWDPGEVSGWPPRYLAGPGPEHVGGQETQYAAGPQAGYLPAPQDDGAREDDDTSPIPVVRDPLPPSPGPRHRASASTQEKLDQIKDLYLTAEAIGEDALVRHFEQLSQRQRALISEYFERAGLGPGDAPARRGDDSAQDGAPLPG